jgi:hypothetical protein
MAQQAYNATRSELRVLKRQYLTLSSAIPARSRNCVLKKTSPLDSNITHQGQKYALFCQFWVANNLFPTIPQPNVDPRGATRWSSPDAKLKGAMAELYLFIPKDLHQSMETYTRFGSLVSARHSILKFTLIPVFILIIVSSALQSAPRGRISCTASRTVQALFSLPSSLIPVSSPTSLQKSKTTKIFLPCQRGMGRATTSGWHLCYLQSPMLWQLTTFSNLRSSSK